MSMSVLTWLGRDDKNEVTAFASSPRTEIDALPQAALLNDLLSRLYEGDGIFYLSATDAYAVSQENAVEGGHQVALQTHVQRLFSFPADDDWLHVARNSHGFIWLVTQQDFDAAQCPFLTFQQLTGKAEKGKVEIIAVFFGDVE